MLKAQSAKTIQRLHIPFIFLSQWKKNQEVWLLKVPDYKSDRLNFSASGILDLGQSFTALQGVHFFWQEYSCFHIIPKLYMVCKEAETVKEEIFSGLSILGPILAGRFFHTLQFFNPYCLHYIFVFSSLMPSSIKALQLLGKSGWIYFICNKNGMCLITWSLITSQ